MAFSQYLAVELSEYLAQNHLQLPPPPTNIYLSLHTSEPDASDVGASELVGLGYARSEVIFDAATPSALEVTLTSNNSIVFPTATGTSAQPITHFAVWDSTTGGDALLFGPWNVATDWIVGATFTVPVGQLVLPLITRVVTVTP